jgi:CheY-like chemotaxis protein
MGMIEDDLAGAHVLIIEDDRDLLELISLHLDGLGCRVSTALSGEEGLQRAFTDTPDVAIVDIGLPSMDGREVIRALRANEETRHCHIIVASVLDPQDMASPDIDAMLAKPFRRDALTGALRTYAHRRPPPR